MILNKVAILMNGPASVGKDDALANYFYNTTNCKYYPAECKDKLIELLCVIFSIQEDEFRKIYEDRGLKEVPNNMLKSLYSGKTYFYFLEQLGSNVEITQDGGEEYFIFSPRQALIFVSELVAKPALGNDYFGAARAKFVSDISSPVFIDGSAAFEDELPPLIRLLGEENILLLRVHRYGYDFTGDSRGYLPDGVFSNTIDIYNNGTLEEYLQTTDCAIGHFLKQKGIINE